MEDRTRTKVTATAAALGLLEQLTHEHGRVTLFVSGGCCDGSSPICLLEGELVLGPRDLHLGAIGETAVYIDRDQFERWNAPDLLIDASPGPAEGFSLDSLEDAHFVLRTRRLEPVAPTKDADR